MRLRRSWLLLLTVVGLATGLGLGGLAFGVDRAAAAVSVSLPDLGAWRSAVERLAVGTPLPTDLLAAGCLAAIVLLCLRDLVLARQDRRRHRAIRALAVGR